MIHGTESAQISQQDGRNTHVNMKRICPSVSFHNAIVVMTGRVLCFYGYICFTPVLLLWDLSTFCVLHHVWSLILCSLRNLLSTFLFIGTTTMKLYVNTCIIVLFLNLEFKLKSLFQYPNTLMDSECYRLLLDPGPEWSYELGSVLPFFRLSVLLSGGFLWIGSLVFSKTQHCVRGLCVVVLERVGFFKKIFFVPKMGKMGQKCAKNRVFEVYWKII